MRRCGSSTVQAVAFAIAAAASWGPANLGDATAAEPAAAMRGPTGAPRRPRTIVDHAVTPAGLGCRHCGAGVCPLHHGHLDACRDGLCAPHCPVRPSQYGFYRTQWRRWPGEGVVPASAAEAATPVPPPAVQIPGPDEESPRSPEDESAVPEPDAEVVEPEEDAPAKRLPANPAADDAGDAADPAEPPSDGPPVPPTPPGEPPVPPEAEDPTAGLLDQSLAPGDDPSAGVTAGSMRYPTQVGRSLATGVAPWRLGPTLGQRAVGSARGL